MTGIDSLFPAAASAALLFPFPTDGAGAATFLLVFFLAGVGTGDLPAKVLVAIFFDTVDFEGPAFDLEGDAMIVLVVLSELSQSQITVGVGQKK